MFARALTAFLALAITSGALAQPPTVVKVTTDGDTITGELVKEGGGKLSVLDFKTGRVRTLERREIRQVRRDIPEAETLQTVGLANYLVWQVQQKTRVGRLQGRVASVSDGHIYFNLGTRDGVERNEEFEVVRVGAPILDPETGEVIGNERTKLSTAAVVDVQDKVSKAKLTSGLLAEIKVGDLVRLPSARHAIAVLPLVDPDGAETVYTRALAEELNAKLVNRGLRIVERRELDRVVQERFLQAARSFEPDAAKRIGSLVGANALVIGTISAKKRYHEAQVRIVDVDKGEILGAITHAVRNPDMNPLPPERRMPIMPDVRPADPRPTAIPEPVIWMDFENVVKRDDKFHVPNLGTGPDGIGTKIAIHPDGKSGKAVGMDKVGRIRIPVPVFNRKEEYTVTMWAKFSNASRSVDVRPWQLLMRELVGDTHVATFAIAVHDRAIHVTTANTDREELLQPGLSAPIIKNNEWCFLVIRRRVLDSGQGVLDIWIDLDAKASMPMQEAKRDGASQVELGYEFCGWIDDVRVFTQALSDEQLGAIYRRDFREAKPPPPALRPGMSHLPPSKDLGEPLVPFDATPR